MGPDYDGANMPLADSPPQWELLRVLDKGRGLVKLANEEISLATRNSGVGWGRLGWRKVENLEGK